MFSSLDCSTNETILECDITPPTGMTQVTSYLVLPQNVSVDANDASGAAISVQCGGGGASFSVRSVDACGQSSSAVSVSINSSVCVAPSTPPPPPSNLSCTHIPQDSTTSSASFNCLWQLQNDFQVDSFRITFLAQQFVRISSARSANVTVSCPAVETDPEVTIVSVNVCGTQSEQDGTTVSLPGQSCTLTLHIAGNF